MRSAIVSRFGAGGLQHREFWGALAAMYRRSHGEGGCSGTLSFGIAMRACVWADLYEGLSGVPLGLGPVKAYAATARCRAEMSLTLGA